MMWRFLAPIAVVLFIPAILLAQDAATLIADRVEVSGSDAIVAEGNVEVLFGTRRLTATRVTYDRAGDSLTIEGPITLADGDSVTIIADAAELDADLRSGLLVGARLVLDQQLQLAAHRIDRMNGRYTQLSRAVASSCRVCPGDPVPLWEIRARKVIHDQIERQVYFEGAQFRLAGIPLAYLPYFRFPDPTLKRSTGFLFPEIRSTSLLGVGARTPYFLALGDHADLRVTPWLSPETSTLETRYRHEFSFGSLTLDGAVSQDRLVDKPRAYLFAQGSAPLPDDFRLSFDLELVSDPSYLSDYGFSGKDRLENSVRVRRTRADEDFRFSASVFRTLRGSELPIKDQVTGRFSALGFTRKVPTGAVGGEAWLTLDATALGRPSDADIVGRDVAHADVSLDWRNDWILGPGLLTEAEVGVRAQAYVVRQDSNFPGRLLRTVPHAAVGVRWPLRRTGETGAVHLLEPAVVLAWSDTLGGDVPNEDSTLVELDEGNLFGHSRFPGSDRTEEGLRANLGLGWTRHDPDGWSLGATVGRIVRFNAPTQFAAGTGLSGASSDWLVAFQYAFADQLLVTSRSLFDGSLRFTRSETRLAWSGKRATVASTYSFADAIPAEGRDDVTSEWTVDAGYQIGRHWTSRARWRYDTDEGKAASAGLGLRYQNECIGVDLSLSRRFTSSATVLPTTDIAFRVSFDGFGTGRNARDYRRSCNG